MSMQNPYDQKQKYKFTYKVKGIQPLGDHIIASGLAFGQRTLQSGIVLLGDDGKTDGIRPRWCKVYKIGPEQKDVKVGQWILVEHGRWTRNMYLEIDGEEIALNRIDPTAVMMVSDDEPNNIDAISTAVYGEQKQRIDWSQEGL